jgi:hypothetical protein
MSPVFVIVTVYFSVSPGSAVRSPLTSVKSASLFVAESTAANGLTAAARRASELNLSFNASRRPFAPGAAGKSSLAPPGALCDRADSWKAAGVDEFENT